MSSDDDGTALAEITRVSRLLGADPSLVLHGGGNTSIKGRTRDITGDDVDVVWVKGSGWNLGTIAPEGFAPLRRERLLRLLQLEFMDDATMVNELRQASLDASAPTASIEALLHAFLPARVVLHSHADAIVALTNQPNGRERAAKVLGRGVHVLPYIKPGFVLARAVAEAGAALLGDSDTDALVLANHGLFTFGDDADAVLARHLDLVRVASEELGVAAWGEPGEAVARAGSPLDVARLRRDVSRAAGHPLLAVQSTSGRAAAYATRPDAARVSSRGTATPEHLIYTKRSPMVGRDVAAFVADYRRYVADNLTADREIVEIDPAPRVVLDPELGLITVGRTATAAAVVHDITLHTMDIVDAADRLGGYVSLDEADSFAMEYWELEQVKLQKAGVPPELAGEVAVVTGAASGIGRACAQRLLDQGAAVVGVDLDPAVLEVSSSPAWRGVVGDVSDVSVVREAAETAARDFGGVDILVVAAGIFPPTTPLAHLEEEVWERAMAVNARGVAIAFRELHPYLALSPRGGRVVLVSTKNVTAPGPGAAAYSASKAAAAQAARVAALEWAADGIRVNHVEPDAVFDTAIWTPQLLAERAATYGLTVEEYKTRNLLGVEVTSGMVADGVVQLCSSAFRGTTGAHLTVDGGNDRIV